MLQIANSTIVVDDNACQAFNEGIVVGSKVTERYLFMKGLEKLIEDHDFLKDSTPGQGFLVLPKEMYKYVSAGDGEHTGFAHDYIVAFHRDRVDAYLKRSLAGLVTFAACVVYTKEAYENDPEVDAHKCKLLSFWHKTTHVVVAVLASSGPESPLTPYRLVSNMAGGNNNCKLMLSEENLQLLHQTIQEGGQIVLEALDQFFHDAAKAHEWVDQAKMSKLYWDRYSLVAG